MNPTTLNQLMASFANDSRLAICCDGQRLSFAELAEHVAVEQQRFQNQGLSNGDVLLLPVHKQAKNVIQLLAALNTASATLVYPKLMPEQRLAELQQHATVFMNTDGNLVRLQTPTPALSQQNDPLLGVLSSGSTGEPKRIWHRVSHFLASAAASNQCLPLNPNGFSLLSLPLNHVGGLGVIFRALLNKSAVLFDVAADNIESYQQHDIQRVSLVPTQLQRLIQQTKLVPTTQVLLGGAPIPDTLLTQARELGWRIHRSYGLSEMASQVITEVNPNQWQVLPHAELKIVDTELWVRGKSLCAGYGDPTKLTTPFQDGWLATHDLAHFSTTEFRFIGRRDNQFISGGENVCPENIEQQFINAQLVDDIVVLPKTNAQWGMQTVAVVSPKQGIELYQLTNFSQQHLLPHEQPRHYYAWHQPSGLKVQRAQLIEQVNNNDLETLK